MTHASQMNMHMHGCIDEDIFELDTNENAFMKISLKSLNIELINYE